MTTVNSAAGVATVTQTSNPSSNTTSGSSGSATVDYNEFLQLMVAELQNQDPTQPTDPTQYMSQIASFSQVEQQIQTNTFLSSMLTANTLSQADSLIGKTITSADGNTSGLVSSVSLASDGTATATLSNGSKLAIANGVTVSGS